jgi:hypothetical protein
MGETLEEGCAIRMMKWLKQLFCFHNNAAWYQEVTKFQNLRGERHHKICESCGKHIDTRFYEYEGNGYK